MDAKYRMNFLGSIAQNAIRVFRATNAGFCPVHVIFRFVFATARW
jgi:hypothetical protein